MSEIRLNLIDSQTILSGTVHGSVGDRLVAALSAEPETIQELEAALERFEKHAQSFTSSPMFRKSSSLDIEPYDAGILIIDLAARIVACESTYSAPGPSGQVEYHNGQHSTEIPIYYQLPDDWIFLDSVEGFEAVCSQHRAERLAKAPFDARAVLYGPPLLEFLATNIRYASASRDVPDEETANSTNPPPLSPTSAIHAQWLLAMREDLQCQSPREVMLAKKDFIDADLQYRAFQWSMQLEGPPGLARDSFAYRFGGFGTHEWVLYYGMIRHLLERGFDLSASADLDFQTLVNELAAAQTAWLNEPNPELDGRIPGIVIDNERSRLPEAMGGRSMVVDEDCPVCKMMGDECEAGLEVCFWHLDVCNMDEHFAFSTFLTEEEYLEDLIRADLRHREFEARYKEYEERRARGEAVDDFFLPKLDEFNPYELAEPEPPEA